MRGCSVGPAHHEVAEGDIVVDSDLALGHARVQALLIQLNMLQRVQRNEVVP